jgi:hypothetical protein
MTQTNPMNLILDDLDTTQLLNMSKAHHYLKDSTCKLYQVFRKRPESYKFSRANIVILKMTNKSGLKVLTNKATVMFDIPDQNIPAFVDFVEYYKPNLFIEMGCKFIRFVPIKCKFFRSIDEIEFDEIDV